MMKRLIVMCAVAGLLMTAALAGPVVIDGTDSNDHGFAIGGANQEGWLYMQKVLGQLGSQTGPGTVKVLVDLGTTDGTQARLAIQAAFDQSTLPAAGWTIVHVVGNAPVNAWLTTLSTANTGILYIPTANQCNGDLNDATLAVVNGHASDIQVFVANGGGLFSQAESPTTVGVVSYGWLRSILPTVTVIDGGNAGFINPDLTLTAAGTAALPGLTSADLSTGPWHNYFDGTFGGLQVLATGLNDNGATVNVILGGGAGTSFLPNLPPPPAQPVRVTPKHQACVTRDSRFWFYRPWSDNVKCATLAAAVTAYTAATSSNNVPTMPIGFIGLPQTYHTGDPVLGVQDIVLEELGFYWKNLSQTGEYGGTQNQKLPGSRLCRARKQLAVETIAAIANTSLLGTGPENCPCTVCGSSTNFPPNLIELAGQVSASSDVTAMNSMITVLRKFNARHLVTQDDLAIVGLQECAPEKSSDLRKAAADATTQASCPGLNTTCETAETVFFPNVTATNLFVFPPVKLRFTRSLNLQQFTNSTLFVTILTPNGIPAAYYQVPPTPFGQTGRQFTVDTTASNFNTIIAVEEGTCSDLRPLLFRGTDQKKYFTTDGTNTVYIAVYGTAGAVGRLKLIISSP